ncbi:MAG: formimidoylglutamate deiminase [Sandaracinus sp.]|nr:formimidoylglutamate deiminase [Myxococcales bacterium]MAT25968.1 formimidoylglutamate deiminase [Sandaracinus sp.]MBJ74376.1 formimidoylglutamate deiminase [Sandaracinus sp.]
MRDGDVIRLPGLATAHSHAFQRGLRGRTQRLPAGAAGSFWSWRGLMYRFAERLDPESMYALARFAYAELARHGVTAVGEFHYVHHQPDGTPYGERTTMADAVIRAARDAGLRVTLLRVLYHRAGAGRAPEGAQRRFSDARLEDALADVEALARRWAEEPAVRVGLAPHSVRAVPAEWLEEAARFAAERALPLHAHVAEQRREIRECLAEHGRRPVELLAERGVLGPAFVAVHATHLRPHEVRLLGAARSFACVCRTTERDLGDGAPPLGPLLDAGARLCVGVDSHALGDPFEELRAVELDERVRTEARTVACDGAGLLAAGSAEGYAAIGFEGAEGADRVELDAADPSLAGLGGADAATWADGVIFGASGRAVRRVEVAGEAIVEGGVPRGGSAARRAFEAAVAAIA